jgi:DNA-binding NarL/FixJ family response regulator
MLAGETKPIRVLLCDDHALFRRGLRSMLALEEDMQIVGEAADGQEAQELAAELTPDVVLLDINMPRVTGIQAAQELRRAHPKLGIVMLTMFAEDEIIEQAMAAGADGYLRKDTPFDDLVATVRATVERRSALQEADTTEQLIPTSALTDLTLLQNVVDGLTDREIADASGLTEGAVRERLVALYRRLGVADRTQAAIYALTRGVDSLR